MTAPNSIGTRHGVTVGRRVIQHLHVVLARETGVQAANLLQEAGFAGGEELYAGFTAWLGAERGLASPTDLDAQYLSEALSAFLAEQGWGTVTLKQLGPAVLAIDSVDWAEAIEGSEADYPSCHFTCGLLADFFGRMSDRLVAVMEVECRTRGDSRCRFLAGAPDTLSALYERMSHGLSYAEALGLGGPSGAA